MKGETTMAKKNELLKLYRSREEIDIDTKLGSDLMVRFSHGWKAKVDTVFLIWEPWWGQKYPKFRGYAHIPEGDGYDWEYLTAWDIDVEFDISPYMSGEDITDFEGLLNDHFSEIFYTFEED